MEFVGDEERDVRGDIDEDVECVVVAVVDDVPVSVIKLVTVAKRPKLADALELPDSKAVDENDAESVPVRLPTTVGDSIDRVIVAETDALDVMDAVRVLARVEIGDTLVVADAVEENEFVGHALIVLEGKRVTEDSTEYETFSVAPGDGDVIDEGVI